MLEKNMTNSSKTLEQLEEVIWPESEYLSYLVQTYHRLRRKPINEFTIEDLRIMIGQQIGIEHLIPLALNRLEADPYAEGDYYPGDLLAVVMRIPSEYWLKHPMEATRMDSIADRAAKLLEGLNEIESIKTELRALMSARSWH